MILDETSVCDSDKCMKPKINIRNATPEDCALLLGLIRELAEYEKLSHEVVATADSLKESLFWKHKVRRSCHR
jgi:hypothetical protein